MRRPGGAVGPPLLAAVLAAAILGAAALSWAAAQPDLAPRALEPEELDAATVQRIAFRFELDSLVYPLLERASVPGLVVSVAYAGEVVAAEAYGSADLAAARTLSLDDPLWLASLTKVLTAIVVHDLVAEGVLTLDHPLERWLPDVRVPPPPEGATGPITIRHLLAHTAGFDTRTLGMLLHGAEADPPLSDLAARGLPPRVAAAGERISYCNLCYALLGMVIEAATGEEVEQAFATRLFEPLDLSSGRVRRWTDPAHDAATARPHGRGTRGIEVLEVPALADPTAGGARLSGNDVGRLLAALTAGEPSAPLARGVRSALLTPAHRAHQALPGVTLGMAEALVLGHPVVVHGGDLPGARSLLVVVPQAALALFVHVNGESDPGRPVATADGMHDIRWALAEGLVALLLGDARDAPTASRDARRVDAPGLRAVAGPYRMQRTARTSAEKLLGGAGLAQVPLTVEADGAVVLRPPASLSAERRYLPVEAGLYRREGGGDALAVEWDAHGRPLVHLSVGSPLTLELVPPLERVPVVAASVAAFALLALLVLLSWPVGAYAHWRRRAPRADDAPGSVTAVRWAGRAVAASGLAAIGLVALLLVQALGSLAVAPFLLGATWLALALTALGTLVLAGVTVFGAASGIGRSSTWAFHALLTIAAGMLIVQAVVWNLTPWS